MNQETKEIWKKLRWPIWRLGLVCVALGFMLGLLTSTTYYKHKLDALEKKIDKACPQNMARAERLLP